LPHHLRPPIGIRACPTIPTVPGTTTATVAKRAVCREHGSGFGIIPDSSADPARIAKKTNQLMLMRSRVTRLPADYQRVMTAWLDEHTFEEIGQSIGRCSPHALDAGCGTSARPRRA